MVTMSFSTKPAVTSNYAQVAALTGDCGMILQHHVLGINESPLSIAKTFSKQNRITLKPLESLRKQVEPLPESPRKRKVDASCILDVSSKLSTAILGLEDESSSRPAKRRIIERACLMKKTNSLFEDLKSALDDVALPKEHKHQNERFSQNSWQDDHLHHACEIFPKNKDYIKIAIDCDPKGISRRSVKLAATSSYSLPINIALKHKEVSMEVLELLANTEPSVLIQSDGHDGSASLNIALLKRPSNDQLEIAEMLLKANPDCIRSIDKRFNFPLHVACARSATLDLIMLLYVNYPEACLKKNIHGETPLKIAERNPMCTDDVVKFLRGVTSVVESS